VTDEDAYRLLLIQRHTDKVANIFAGQLKAKGEVELLRLRPASEITSFAGQCRAAFTGKRAELDGTVKTDVSPYDLVIIGCPVWAFAPVPAMNTYLDKVNGLNGKKAIILLTSAAAWASRNASGIYGSCSRVRAPRISMRSTCRTGNWTTRPSSSQK